MSLTRGAEFVFFMTSGVLISISDRYRQVPPFGPATIRRFSANTSEMSNMAARNFEDLLQVHLGDHSHLCSWTNFVQVFYSCLRRPPP